MYDEGERLAKDYVTNVFTGIVFQNSMFLVFHAGCESKIL